MPPINPALIDSSQLAQAQMPQGPATLAGPVPQPPQGQGPIIQPVDTLSNQRTQQLTNQAAVTGPDVARRTKAEADKAVTDAAAAAAKWAADPTNPANKSAVTGVGDAAIADLSPADQQHVKDIAVGKMAMTPYMIARNPAMKALYDRAVAYEPGTDMTTFARRQAAYQKYMAPNSPTVRLNQALAHLDLYQNSMMKVNNFHNTSGLNPAALLNYPKAAIGEAEKDPNYLAAKVNRDAAATELAAAFKGGNDPALASVDHWQSVLSMANSPEAVNSTVQAAVKLLGSRMQAMDYTSKQLLGPNAETMELLDPTARQVFNKYNSDSYDPKDTTAIDPNAKLSTDEQAIKLPPGYQQAHAEFLKNHPPGTLDPDDYIKERQALDQQFGVNSDLTPKAIEQFIKPYNTPGVQFNPNTPVPMGNKPLSQMGKAAAVISESAPGQFLESLTNAGTGGAVDLAAGQGGRDAEQLASAEHPVASGLGDVIGSVGPLGGAEGLAARAIQNVPGLAGKLSPKALKVVSELMGNSGYGAARGFSGANDGEGAQDALGGALAGSAGALVGRGVAKGVTGFLPQTTEDALAKLHGIDLTTLQRLGLGKVESAASGLPFVRSAVENATDSFNEQRANILLATLDPSLKLPKGLSPTERNDFIYNTADKAYNDIKPSIVGSRDSTFENSMTALKGLADTDQKKNMFKQIEQASNLAFDENGHFDGDNFKNAMERLRAVKQSLLDGAENSQDPLANRDMAGVADKAIAQMRTLVSRKVPENVATRLGQIDRAWGGKMQLEDATNRALAQNGGRYSPSQALTTGKKFDLSVNNNLSSRGKMPGQDTLLAAQKIMGSGNVPGKVSPKEIAYASVPITAGAWASAPATGTALGTLAAGYTPGVKRVVQGLLSGQRPRVLNNNITQRAYADTIRRLITGD